MTLAALVPLRSLSDGKRRLQNVLSRAERTALVQRLFLRTQRALLDSGVVAQVGVVSPDPALLAWAAQQGALPIHQPHAGLNPGLTYGRNVLIKARQFTALLVVLPDLPWVMAVDFQQLAAAHAPEAVVLAPDRHERGTNALIYPARTPADLALPFCFGENSLRRHVAVAREHGRAVRLHHAPTLAFDVDTAEDLRLLAAQHTSLL